MYVHAQCIYIWSVWYCLLSVDLIYLYFLFSFLPCLTAWQVDKPIVVTTDQHMYIHVCDPHCKCSIWVLRTHWHFLYSPLSQLAVTSALHSPSVASVQCHACYNVCTCAAVYIHLNVNKLTYVFVVWVGVHCTDVDRTSKVPWATGGSTQGEVMDWVGQ